MFSPSSFSPVSFSQISFNGLKQAEENGRSGYWRLFYTQLQEESLVKDVQPTVKVTYGQEQRQEASTGKGKGTKRKPAVAEREEFPEVRFRRKPIYTSRKPVAESFPIWISLISAEIDSWVSALIPLWNERRQVIISTQSKAANDADFRLRLLLLAA